MIRRIRIALLRYDLKIVETAPNNWNRANLLMLGRFWGVMILWSLIGLLSIYMIITRHPLLVTLGYLLNIGILFGLLASMAGVLGLSKALIGRPDRRRAYPDRKRNQIMEKFRELDA